MSKTIDKQDPEVVIVYIANALKILGRQTLRERV